MESVFPALAYALLALTAITLWLRPWWWLVALTVFLGVCLWQELMTPIALVPLFITGLLYVACTRTSKTSVRLFLIIVVSLLSVALGVHAFPGFTYWEITTVKLSDASASYPMRYYIDKPLIGVIVLGLVAHAGLARSRIEWRDMLSRMWKPLLAGLTVVYALSLILGYTAWDPKFSPVFWPWALKNLLFVCIAEEAFFRGFLQHQFAQMIPHRHAALIALVLAAVLFGIAHIAGGPLYVLLATVAGLLYGYVYHVTNRIEAAILTHFLLNAGHFLFFTYPYLIT